MALKVYNTYSKKKEIFRPLRNGEVRIYTCGPTVYMYAHIGNFRAYVFADILKRYLEYLGYKVKHVSNITDVGHLTQDDIEAGSDKIQMAAEKKKISPSDLARFYEKAYIKDRTLLNLRPLYKMPRATEHIKEMQEMIKGLLKEGFAYEVAGSIYYDIASFKNYGKLSGNTVEKLEEGASGRDVDMNKEKRHFYDFALWVNDPEHIMNWPSPWCEKGYPGWHIECSAMSTKYLGWQFDIHTGGEDNIFPHHEAEIAQTEGYTGKKWVSYWMHARHLLVDGQKMSKRIGNFYVPQDLYNRGFTPPQLRFYLMSTHYRKKLNFTYTGFESSTKALNKILVAYAGLKKVSRAKSKLKGGVEKVVSKAKDDFEKAMNDDLNVSPAFAAVIKLATQANGWLDMLSTSEAKLILNQLENFDIVLGVLDYKTKEVEVPAEIKKLVEEREKARKRQDFKKADEIRNKLKDKGWALEDSAEGAKVRKLF